MHGAQPVQVQIETHGAVPEGMPELAIAKVDSLLRPATEPVLHARVTLTMAADPAVTLPAVARINVDLGGGLVRGPGRRRDDARGGRAHGQPAQDPAGTLGAELGSRRGSRPADTPGEWRHQSIPAHHPGGACWLAHCR